MRYLHYLPALLIFLLLKQWRVGVGAEELRFLLTPTAWLVGGIHGSSYQWVAGSGYYFPAEDFIINAGCAGFTFFLLSFTVLLLAFPLRRMQWWSVLPCLLLAWPLTVLVNASRITSLHRTAAFGLHGELAHEAVGAFIYFFFLTALYLAASRLAKHQALSI